MLYEAAPVGDRLEKQRLFTWDKWSLRDGNDEGIPVDKKIDKAPAVDNYEGMCLVPAEDEVDATKSRRLLLVNDDNSNQKQVGTQFVLLRLPLKGTEKAAKPVPKAFPDTSAPTPPEPYIDQTDDSVHVTLYSIAVLSLCALLVGVIAAAATHVAMKQKSVQMLERSKAPWQSYGSRDEEGAPLIAKRPSLSFSV